MQGQNYANCIKTVELQFAIRNVQCAIAADSGMKGK